MALGKSIRIYLKDGDVSGIKLAEVLNHTIQALSSPRSKLVELNLDFTTEANRPGVYFLIGEDEEGNLKVYIGEAENVWERIKEHGTGKGFWNEVIIFTSKDENLTKGHVKFLESRLINIAKTSERCKLENGNSSKLNSLPLPDRDSMEDFIIYVKILNGTLGYKFLEPPISKPHYSDNYIKQVSNDMVSDLDNLELVLKVKNIEAKALQTNEGIVVLKGSEVLKTDSKSYGYSHLREKLKIENIIIAFDDVKLIFSEDYLFKSPSAAAAVIMGYSINGRDVWKDKNGKSLNEIEKMKVDIPPFNSLEYS